MTRTPNILSDAELAAFLEKRRRIQRRRWRLAKLAVATVVTALATAGSVFAWWSQSGSGTATASVGTLTAATISAPTSVTDPSVQITWSAQAAMTPSSASSAITYTVERKLDSGSFAGLGSGGCSGSLLFGITSCTDTLPSTPTTGTYSYRVVAHYHSAWSATSNTVSVTANLDSDAPTALIAFPASGTTYNAASFNAGCLPTGICGTAADGSGVHSVKLSIRQGSGNYWDGSAFNSPTELFNASTLASPDATSTSWNYGLSLPADGTYTVHVQTADTVGNALTGTTYAANETFTIDTTPPTIAREVVADATANTAGFITQGGSYYAYAQVSDSGTGVGLVGTDLHTTTTGATSVVMTTSGGPWTIGGQSYNYRSTIETANNPLAESGNPYAYSVSAADAVTNLSTANSTVNVDNSGPAGGAVTINGLVGTGAVYSASTTLSLTLSAGADGGAGNAASPTFVLKRATAPLTSAGTENGSCGSYGSFSTITTGPSASYTDNAAGGITTGNCYRYQYVVTDKLGNQTTYTSAIDAKVDTTTPSIAAVTPSNAGGNTFVDGSGTVWVNGQATKSGSFDVAATATDSESGIQKVNFPTFGATSATDVTTPPYALHYTWSGAVTAGSKTVTATNNATLTKTGAFTVTSDTTNPNGGAIVANGTGSASFNTTGTVALSVTNYGDGAGSGMASNIVTRATAPLSGNTCGSFAGTTVVAGNSDGPLANACYQYTLTGIDNVGNVSTATSAVVKVDTTAPSVPTLSFTGLSSNAFYSAGQNTLYFRPATGGAFTVTASSTDPETAIKAGNAGYAFSSLSGNNFTGTQTSGQTAYTFGATATQPSGDATVAATNNAGLNSSNASYHVKLDNTAPSGGAVTVNGVAASAGGSTSTTTNTGFSVTGRSDYTEAQSSTASGLASSTLTIQSATLASGVCGAAGSGGPYTSATTIVGTANPAITVGYCYVYTLAGIDNVGNATSVKTTVSVFTSPTVTSAPAVGQGATNWPITVTGTGFVNGAGLSASVSGTGVTVNSTSFVSATTLTVNVTVASNATLAARNITVTNPDGGSGTGAGVVTIDAGPTVTSPTATSPCNSGHNTTANCTITGTNFAVGVTVTISANGSVNSVTRNSSTSLTISVTGSGGNKATGNLTVTNPDGGSVTVVNGFSNG